MPVDECAGISAISKTGSESPLKDRALSLIDDLMEQLGGDATRRIGGRLDLDEATTSKAIGGALPMMVGGLARNAQQSGGADSLLGALTRDHDGSVLDDLAGYVSQGPGRHGEGILGHVFGGQRQTVEAGLGRLSGLDSSKASELLAMLAPLVMGFLGKQRSRQGLDASVLRDMLGREQRRTSGDAGAAMEIVGKLLDRDGDGDFTDDVRELGAGLLGNLLGGKR